jgi:hypothetical protein
MPRVGMHRRFGASARSPERSLSGAHHRTSALTMTPYTRHDRRIRYWATLRQTIARRPHVPCDREGGAKHPTCTGTMPDSVDAGADASVDASVDASDQ